jgi:hypothetical protein
MRVKRPSETEPFQVEPDTRSKPVHPDHGLALFACLLRTDPNRVRSLSGKVHLFEQGS